jgi:hypothetical protein
MWKMRNLPFLFVSARPARLSAATDAVKIAPFRRNVRRVMGERDFVALAFITWICQSSTPGANAQAKGALTFPDRPGASQANPKPWRSGRRQFQRSRTQNPHRIKEKQLQPHRNGPNRWAFPAAASSSNSNATAPSPPTVAHWKSSFYRPGVCFFAYRR